MTQKTLLAVAVSIWILLGATSPAGSVLELDNWTDDQFRAAFDETARNYGAVEYATYTFMVEFGRPPHSLDELRESGHLNVLMTNPYTGGEIFSLTLEDYPDGDLAGNIFVLDRKEGTEAHLEIWFIRPGDTSIVRSMVKVIYIYQSEPDRAYLFQEDLPRDEQFVAVYCRQSIDALESFEQRNGRTPEDFDDMYENGDVNVHYINPINNELAVSTGESSPGDFMYRKIGEEGFTIIGWGRERPVFFATTETSEEEWFYSLYPELLENSSETEEESVDDEDCEHEH